jgi:hypothetical protein
VVKKIMLFAPAWRDPTHAGLSHTARKRIGECILPSCDLADKFCDWGRKHMERIKAVEIRPEHLAATSVDGQQR